MALQIQSIDRKFSFKKNGKDIVLADPNPEYSPEAVLSFYANQYPEFTNANIHGPSLDNGIAIYEIKATVGVKG